MTSTTLASDETNGEMAMSHNLGSAFHAIRGRALSILAKLDWLALLSGRLAVGLLFVSTGWGKVHSIPKVMSFFEQLGIPAPGFHAVLVAWTELLCGSALVLGLCTRLAAVPLAITMVVAIVTAKLPDIHGIFDLVGADEFTYLVVLVMLVILGPGRAAIDHMIARRLDPHAA
jgi:putative oxidoreductase